MEISKQLLYKNLEFLAIEQLAEEFRLKGYTIEKNKALGKFEADLIAIKGEEKIVFEIKTDRMTPKDKIRLAQYADYVNSLGNYKFKVVLARPPKEKSIEIIDFERILLEYIIDNMPSNLDELSSHTSIEMISDIEIHNLIIHQNKRINVIGQGTIEVELQFGSAGDQTRDIGYIDAELFPFDFNLYLSYNLKNQLFIEDGASFDINTDSYYE